MDWRAFSTYSGQHSALHFGATAMKSAPETDKEAQPKRKKTETDLKEDQQSSEDIYVVIKPVGHIGPESSLKSVMSGYCYSTSYPKHILVRAGIDLKCLGNTRPFQDLYKVPKAFIITPTSLSLTFTTKCYWNCSRIRTEPLFTGLVV